MIALRGQVFRVDLGHGPKPWLLISNDARNRNVDTVLAARITTTSKHSAVPTVVALSPADRDELTVVMGTLSATTMNAVSAALRIALP